MTNINSEKKTVRYSAEQVFNFIENFNHFESLLPADKVENFKSTRDTCSFRIKNMADLALIIEERVPFSRIKMSSEGKKPFPFSMTVLINPINENECEVYIEFEGDINPFMKMMVEKPLTNFFNMLVTKLTELDLTKSL